LIFPPPRIFGPPLSFSLLQELKKEAIHLHLFQTEADIIIDNHENGRFLGDGA